jgi:hypothetical protein
MEHRNSERKAVSLDAVIGCPRFGLIRGRIEDLGLDGLYISAQTSIVPIGAEVTVTFPPGEEICPGCLSIKGRVRHQSLQGFGVEFLSPEPRCLEALERLLPAMPPTLVRAAPLLRAI